MKTEALFIRVDKPSHRLNWVPVQDACIALDVGDATALPSSVYRLLRVIAAVPDLERFMDSVCETIFTRDASLLPGNLRSRDPATVPQVCLVNHFVFQFKSNIFGIPWSNHYCLLIKRINKSLDDITSAETNSMLVVAVCCVWQFVMPFNLDIMHCEGVGDCGQGFEQTKNCLLDTMIIFGVM